MTSAQPVSDLPSKPGQQARKADSNADFCKKSLKNFLPQKEKPVERKPREVDVCTDKKTHRGPTNGNKKLLSSFRKAIGDHPRTPSRKHQKPDQLDVDRDFEQLDYLKDDSIELFEVTPIKPTNAVDSKKCTPIFTYPSSKSSKHQYLIYLEPNENVFWESALEALKGAGKIGKFQKTEIRGAYWASEATVGHFRIRTKKGRLTAYVSRHESNLVNHKGRFAVGVASFLCGLTASDYEYRVVLRGELQKVKFVVSRSYAGDCIRNYHKRPALKEFPTAPGPDLKRERPSVIPGHWFISQGPQILRGKDFNKDKVTIELGDDNEKARKPPCPGCKESSTKPDLFDSLGVFFMNERQAHNSSLTMKACRVCENDVFLETKGFCDLARRAVRRKSSTETIEQNENASENIEKYRYQRFRLVSRYTSDLKLTTQAWFSICPEEIAKHIAGRIATLSIKLNRKIRVLDPFCGAGGNIIHVACMEGVEKVYAYDINEEEINSLKKMAELYKVSEKVHFGIKNFLELEPEFIPDKIDAIVSSPPWGGPAYLQGKYDFAVMNPSYKTIMERSKQFTANIAMLLPRNSCLDQLVQSAAEIQSAGVELELNFIQRKVKTATAYYGDLVNLK